ncbi:MAG: CoA transferase subunit A [Lachnospirales bacterium]
MKVIGKDIFKEHLKDGMSIMVGGFMTNGTPEILIDLIVESEVKDLTLICNDAGYEDKGIGKLIANGLVKKLITSHIGLNPLAGKLMNEGKLDIELVPQGTLAERIRSFGAGLGGVLTQTGLGTDVANGKETLQVDGKEFLLEKPLGADLAIIRGTLIDKAGNVFYSGTTRNFNPLMATACSVVFATCEKLVEVGEIQKEAVITPSIFVDYVVEGVEK